MGAYSFLSPPRIPDSRLQFNLETPDVQVFKEALKPYRSLSNTPSLLPFELQVLLSVPDLSANQVLVCRGADSSRLRIEPTPQSILLESWSVQFSPRREGSGSDADLGLSTVYKHGIGLFRSIYTLLRVLPTWKLHKRLRRRGAVPSNRNANLNIELRVRSGQNQDGVLGFGKHLKAACFDMHILISASWLRRVSGSASTSACHRVTLVSVGPSPLWKYHSICPLPHQPTLPIGRSRIPPFVPLLFP
jgi:hypothetical protein